MAETSIEWTDATWNPVAGCTVLTAGCTNCYAMRMAARLDAMGMKKYRGLTRKSGKRAVWTGKVGSITHSLHAPQAGKSRAGSSSTRCRTCFMTRCRRSSSAPSGRVMQETPRHTYQILTKRPDRMAQYWLRLLLGSAIRGCPEAWARLSFSPADRRADARWQQFDTEQCICRFPVAEINLYLHSSDRGLMNHKSRALVAALR